MAGACGSGLAWHWCRLSLADTSLQVARLLWGAAGSLGSMDSQAGASGLGAGPALSTFSQRLPFLGDTQWLCPGPAVPAWGCL